MSESRSEKLLLYLMKAETEEAVLQKLRDEGFWEDANCWRILGGPGFESNVGIVQNQQVLASAALTEKIVNAVDAVLMRVAGERGIDAHSRKAPKTMKKAVELFWGVKNGDIATLDARQRTRLAEECIALVATGTKDAPCLSVIDKGEGQGPEWFEQTFLKLCGSYKRDVPFVQGTYHMGGTGVIPYCGARGFQLIVSRRHPSLLREGESRDWGWTLIRRNPPKNDRPSVYEYLVLHGRIPSVAGSELTLWPDGKSAYALGVPFGTAVKLFNYQFEQRSLNQKITIDLQYQLGRRLFDIPLPMRIYERRSERMKGHTHESTFSGLRARIQGIEEDDSAGKTRLEVGFPTSAQLNYGARYPVPVWVTVFSREGLQDRQVRERFSSPTQAVLLTINGQTHATYGRQFFTTKGLKLDYIKDDLLVAVDCTHLPMEIREDIFMGSRDRPRESERTGQLKADLEQWLHSHDGLRLLNARRREELTQARLEQDTTLRDVLSKLVGSSPALRSLFGSGEHIRVVGKPTLVDEPAFSGMRFPTHFSFQGANAECVEKTCPENAHCKAVLLTNAENAYFTRVDEPGTIQIRPEAAYRSYSLWNGKLTIVLRPLPGVHAGHSFPVEIEINDPSRIEPLKRYIDLEILPGVETGQHPAGTRKRKSEGLSLPEPHPVYKSEWALHGFDQSSGISLRNRDDGAGGYDIFVNMDNAWLSEERRRCRSKPEVERREKTFQVGLTVLTFALLSELAPENGDSRKPECEDKEEADPKDTVAVLSRGLARVVIPLFDGITALSGEPFA